MIPGRASDAGPEDRPGRDEDAMAEAAEAAREIEERAEERRAADGGGGRIPPGRAAHRGVPGEAEGGDEKVG